MNSIIEKHHHKFYKSRLMVTKITNSCVRMLNCVTLFSVMYNATIWVDNKR